MSKARGRRRWRALVLWIAIPVVLLAALAYGGFQLVMVDFYPDPPAKNYPKPSNPLEAQRQDLDYFRRVLALDRSFSDAARREAAERISSLSKSDKVLRFPQLLVALMRIEALADNGHTKMRFSDPAMPTELPVRVSEFSDGFYVMQAKNDGLPLLGGKLLAVDGQQLETVLKKLEALKGGAPIHRLWYAATYILMPQVLNGLGIAKDDRHSVWTVRLPGGHIVSQRLTAYAPKHEPYVFEERWYFSELSKDMGPGWRAFAPDAPPPPTLRNYDRAFRLYWLPHSCVAVIQFKSNMDVGDQKIGDFLRTAQKELAAHRPCSIIFDNRFNGGGDYTTTVSFARHLPDATEPGGRIYLLTSRATFSAGITTTAFIKEAGGGRVVILGEPVGDRLAFYAEGGRTCLPNSKLCMGYETGKHDYANPCRDIERCYWLNWFYPVRVKSLDPDERIGMSFAEWRAGQDPVFERAVRLATAKH
jgi:hypothetical protein